MVFFADLLHEHILQVKPDILVTYGGWWMGKLLLRWGHEHHLKNVVLLQNLVYSDPSCFHDVDLTIVPSQFASDHYAEKLGIKTTPITPIMDWNLIQCDNDASEQVQIRSKVCSSPYQYRKSGG